jgi:hypothetical protein
MRTTTKDEDDWRRYTLMLTRMRGGGKAELQGADRYRPRKRGSAPWLPAFGELASDLLAQR